MDNYHVWWWWWWWIPPNLTRFAAPYSASHWAPCASPWILAKSHFLLVLNCGQENYAHSNYGVSFSAHSNSSQSNSSDSDSWDLNYRYFRPENNVLDIQTLIIQVLVSQILVVHDHLILIVSGFCTFFLQFCFFLHFCIPVNHHQLLLVVSGCSERDVNEKVPLIGSVTADLYFHFFKSCLQGKLCS